jgi:hypothetical protein
MTHQLIFFKKKNDFDVSSFVKERCGNWHRPSPMLRRLPLETLIFLLSAQTSGHHTYLGMMRKDLDYFTILHTSIYY